MDDGPLVPRFGDPLYLGDIQDHLRKKEKKEIVVCSMPKEDFWDTQTGVVILALGLFLFGRPFRGLLFDDRHLVDLLLSDLQIGFAQTNFIDQAADNLVGLEIGNSVEELDGITAQEYF